MKKFISNLIFLLVLSVFIPLPVCGDDDLKGIKDIRLNIHVDDSIATYLNEGNLKTLIELEFRRSGINIVNDATEIGSGRFDLLIVSKLLAEHSLGEKMFAVAIDSMFFQQVEILVSGNQSVASSYHIVWMGGFQTPNADIVEKGAMALVREFLNEFLEANPI